MISFSLQPFLTYSTSNPEHTTHSLPHRLSLGDKSMFCAEHICAFTGTTQLPRNPASFPGQYLPWLLVLLFFPSSVYPQPQSRWPQTRQTISLYYLKASVSRWHHFLLMKKLRITSLPSKDCSVDEHHVTTEIGDSSVKDNLFQTNYLCLGRCCSSEKCSFPREVLASG